MTKCLNKLETTNNSLFLSCWVTIKEEERNAILIPAAANALADVFSGARSCNSITSDQLASLTASLDEDPNPNSDMCLADLIEQRIRRNLEERSLQVCSDDDEDSVSSKFQWMNESSVEANDDEDMAPNFPDFPI